MPRHLPLALTVGFSLTVLLAVPGCSGTSGLHSDANLRVEADSYTVVADGEFYRAEIPYAFENRTGRTVYLVNCNGDVTPALEKRVGDEWVTAWQPVMNQCLSPPIVIEPDATYSDTVSFEAGRPGSDFHPRLETDRVPGTYRLAWSGVVWDYDEDRAGFGEPLPGDLRVSNPFELALE